MYLSGPTVGGIIRGMTNHLRQETIHERNMPTLRTGMIRDFITSVPERIASSVCGLSNPDPSDVSQAQYPTNHMR